VKRRTFIKNGILGTIGTAIIPGSILPGRDCISTHPDILGPYWSNNHPRRIILANSEEPGTRIFISGVVTADDCETPIQNALVDVWHANDNGCYSVFQECQSGNSNNDPYNLRGIISTDQYGYYGFESILPGYYAGRPRHFHYKITSPSGLELITQCYFEVDPLINEDWEQNHPGLVIPLEETENGLVGEFNIVLNEEVSTVSVDSKSFSLSKRFSLHTVYPNPSNNSIKIDFIINNFGYVDIGIYDITGKWVSNLVGKKMHRGKYNIVWKGDNMLGKKVASGTYLVMMKFGGSIQTKKIELIK
tara:strand:+ start:1327 stop:2238 length:912 start_codon:yes stop_codon:yes gene_type:complete